jgi:DNA (cytosine-5)-methyltransferase 1
VQATIHETELALSLLILASNARTVNGIMANKKPDNFRFIDLFAGVGGMRLAFERANGSCVFSSEWDKFSQQTYFANFKETPHGDITKIHERSIPKYDVLVAGFPCQPFSTIGKRQGFSHATQGTMFHEVVRIMRHHKNRAFLLENVPGIQTHDGGRTLEIIEETLTELKYRFDYRVLNAADFGVPQHRSRIYIVGYKSRLGGRTELDWPVGNKTHRAIGPFIESGIQDHSITKHLQKVYLFKKNDGKPQIVDKSSDFPVKTLVASYHKIQRLTGTFVHDDETGLRLLSENECKAIMGFKKGFEVPVSRTQMYRQFGNSVAVPVVTVLAKWIASDFLDT